MSNNPKKSYVITKDVVPTLQNRLGLSLSEDCVSRIREVESGFISELWSFVKPEDEHVVLEPEDIVSSVRLSLNREVRPLVCFDDVYFSWIKEMPFSITRLTDPNDPHSYVFGPRHGFPPLERQIKVISDRYGSGDIAFVDVGAFSANSMTEPLNLFRSAGLVPRAVHLGLSGKSAVRKLEDAGLEVNVGHTYEFDDWLELRDLLGIDGRKVDKAKMSAEDIARLDGKTLFMPYKEDPADWASVPPDKQVAFGVLCDKYFARLQEVLRLEGYLLDSTEVARSKFGIFNLTVSRSVLKKN